MVPKNIAERAGLDLPTNRRISSIRRAYSEFESRLTQSRLVLARSFHEARSFAVEAHAMSEARVAEKRNAVMDYSAIINLGQEHAMEHFRDSSATTYLSTIDGLVSSLWHGIGLPAGPRGGVVVRKDVSLFELFDLAGNYFRHRHEWWRTPGKMRRDAARNTLRLSIAGLPYHDPLLAGRIVDIIPFDNHVSLEIELLETADFLTFAAQQHVLQDFAKSQGETYRIPYGAHDTRHRAVLGNVLRKNRDLLGTVGPP